MVLFFQFILKMAVHAACTKRKICKVNNSWCFFKTSYLHIDVLSRRVSFPFKCGKAIFQQSRRLKSQNGHAHRDTDFTKLGKLCQIRRFPPTSTSENVGEECWFSGLFWGVKQQKIVQNKNFCHTPCVKLWYLRVLFSFS